MFTFFSLFITSYFIITYKMLVLHELTDILLNGCSKVVGFKNAANINIIDILNQQSKFLSYLNGQLYGQEQSQ